MTKTRTHLEFRLDMKTFLKDFGIKDSKDITDKVHENLLKNHFYYVDHFEQGWYVFDDPEIVTKRLKRDLSSYEYEIYGELWSLSVAYG